MKVIWSNPAYVSIEHILSVRTVNVKPQESQEDPFMEQQDAELESKMSSSCKNAAICVQLILSQSNLLTDPVTWLERPTSCC